MLVGPFASTRQHAQRSIHSDLPYTTSDWLVTAVCIVLDQQDTAADPWQRTQNIKQYSKVYVSATCKRQLQVSKHLIVFANAMIGLMAA